MKCLRGVIFSVWVHGYAVGLWHPFVCWVFFCGCSCCACGFAQHDLLQVPFGCYTTFLAASACSAPALEAWVGQPPFPLRSQCFSCAGWLADDRWVPHPVRVVLPWGL